MKSTMLIMEEQRLDNQIKERSEIRFRGESETQINNQINLTMFLIKMEKEKTL